MLPGLSVAPTRGSESRNPTELVVSLGHVRTHGDWEADALIFLSLILTVNHPRLYPRLFAGRLHSSQGGALRRGRAVHPSPGTGEIVEKSELFACFRGQHIAQCPHVLS